MADAGAGTAVKDGNGSARLTALAGGVSNLMVSAGTLAISGRPKLTNVLTPGGVAEAEIPAGDFEDWTGASASCGSDGEFAGWHLVGLHGSENNSRDVVIFTSGDGSGSGWTGNSSAANGYGSPLPAPDGSRIMMLKGNSSAWTEVTIPVDGEYALTFQGAARSGYSGLWVDILIGPNDDALLPIATVSSQVDWKAFSFRTPWLAAGKHRLWFRNKEQNIDKTFALDNVRLAYRPGDAVRKMSVPNGSFEGTVADFKHLNTNDNALCWHLIPGEVWTGSGTPPIYVALPSMGGEKFEHSYNRFGTRQLVFRANGSTAENTFTVSQDGSWRLRLAMAVLRTMNYCATSSTITGEIVRGDDVIPLGSATMDAYHLRDVTLPDAVALTAGETVTLRLRVDWVYDENNAKDCVTVVDDLVFVDAMTPGAPVNLITHGGFESWDGWNFVKYEKSSSYISGSTIWSYSANAQNYGYAVYEGLQRATIVQNDITWRTFNVPEAGLYRLTYYTHSRMDNPRGSGDNPVYAFWVDPDEPATTNMIGRSLVTSTNFVQSTYTFMLPKKDGLIFGLQGGYSHLDGVAELTGYDHTTLLDGVSICREPDALPDVPENLSIAVATGAKLVLDFDGEITLVSCRLGGAGRAGEITAEKYPQYLSGPGRLYVKPRNLVILIR